MEDQKVGLGKLGQPLLSNIQQPVKILRRGDPGYWELSAQARRDIEAMERHLSPLIRKIILD